MFPELRIEVRELTTHEILRQLKSRDLDIGILSTPINDPSIVEHDLYDEPFVLYDAGMKNELNVDVQTIDLTDLWLMEEGHCFRTQVLKLCDVQQRLTNSQLNFDFKAGSIDSLMRFVRANRATTLLPFLSTADFTTDEQAFVKSFVSPVPSRKVGLVVHQYFVKHKVLQLLKDQIIQSVTPHIPDLTGKSVLLDPL